MTRKSRNRGFTLFELLIVLALLLLLLGLLVPAVQKVREAAARTQCSNNLKQICLAMHNMHDTYGRLPGVFGDFPNEGSTGTYFFFVLPFIEQDNLYKNAASGDGSHFSVWNNNTYGIIIKTYVCPSDNSGSADHLYDGWLGTSSYAANYLVFGTAGTRIPTGFPDGTSNTIAFTERYQVCNKTPNGWGYSGDTDWAPVVARANQGLFQTLPIQAQCNPALAQGIHYEGIQVGMGDGSTRIVDSKLSAQTWYYALCPNDGMVLGNDW